MIRHLAGFAILVATGCREAPPPPRHEFTELHMGMAVRVVLYAPDTATARGAARAALDRIAELEDVFSDYRAGSELRRLEPRAGEWVVVSPPLLEVLAAAHRVAAITDGAFDPTVAPLVALWRESRQSGRLPDAATLDSARALVGWRQLEVDTVRGRVRLARAGVRLDLGGIAKGYILGRALAALRAHGVTSALIEAGGDIVLGDPPPGRTGWDVGLGDLDVGRLANLAIATSGTGEQWVEIGGTRYAHILDPATGLGLIRATTATVIGPDPMIADALATAVVVSGADAVPPLRARFDGYRVWVW